MQRHHLLPKQLLGERSFGTLFEQIGRDRIGFDDFRLNGLLLPSREDAAMRVRMPLHRGPHRDYNGMVAERVGQIEATWSQLRLRAPEVALDEALMRLDLLQRALRRRLLAADRPKIRLNRHDRLDLDVDFADLDAMADALWAGTGSAAPAAEAVAEAPLEWGVPERPSGASPPRQLFVGELPAPAISAPALHGERHGGERQGGERQGGETHAGERPAEPAPDTAPAQPFAAGLPGSPLHRTMGGRRAVEQLGQIALPAETAPPAVQHPMGH